MRRTGVRKCILPVLLLAAVLPCGATAATFEFIGQIANTTGGFTALTPVGTLIEGTVTFNDDAVAAGHAGIADLEALDINVGVFCFRTSFNSIDCPNGSAYVPVTHFHTVSVAFVSGLPTVTILEMDVGGAGPIEVFQASFADGLFTLDAGPVGGVTGPANWVVPLPAPVWLFASGLIALAGRLVASADTPPATDRHPDRRLARVPAMENYQADIMNGEGARKERAATGAVRA